ncbi:LmeA family phospholipid-binding protein [Actinomyces wuliandei]|uniref:LmeA family phospholipid-binding protein n=1 Tax=Actinomyces wuliandei TaxID=2057743 RepID=UPI001C56B9D3|nr:DUF2993 domain-containing protein [Actinomyces wuliandei]
MVAAGLGPQHGDVTGAVGGGPARDRPRAGRRRRWPVVLLVLLLALGGAGVAGEYYARDRVETEVRGALPGLSQDAKVSTEGIVLLQAAQMSLRSLDVTASSLTLEGSGASGAGGRDGGDQSEDLSLADLSVSMRQVGLHDPVTAASVDISATVPWEQVGAAMEEASFGDTFSDLLAGTSSGVDVTVTADQVGTSAQDPGSATASASVLGQEVEIGLVPAVGEDGGLVLDVTSVSVGGSQEETDTGLGAVGGLAASLALEGTQVEVPAELLPGGLGLSEASVVPEGLRVRLEGEDVALSQM